MEQKGLFAYLLRTLITTLFWLWIMLALTLCGAFIGFMINLAFNQNEVYPLLIYGFTALGFLIGLYKAESLRKKRALVEHMAGLVKIPEFSGNK